MLSIDEAIAKHRKIAETQKTLYDACVLKECNKHFLRKAEEHEQLAAWLEELKALRKERSEFQIIVEANYEMGMENGYNKALDEFIYTIEPRMEWDNQFYALAIEHCIKIAEQLKEQNK